MSGTNNSALNFEIDEVITEWRNMNVLNEKRVVSSICLYRVRFVWCIAFNRKVSRFSSNALVKHFWYDSFTKHYILCETLFINFKTMKIDKIMTIRDWSKNVADVDIFVKYDNQFLANFDRT